MTRWEFVTSNQYVITNIELIVKSRKPILQMREELNDFFLRYKGELLHGDQSTGCNNRKCKVCYAYGKKSNQ